MRYSMILLALLSACTTMHKYEAAPQNYRLKGSDKQITITGKLDQVKKEGVLETTIESKLTVYIDGIQSITGYLDQHFSGEFSGLPYDGKPTSASCSTKAISVGVGETRCIIFIDNERTATLTM